MTEQIFNLDNRIKALLALLELRRADEKLVARVNQFRQNSHEARELRNRVVHDTWHQSVDTKQMMQLEIGAKGSLTYDFKPIDRKTLQHDMETVRKAMREAGNIRNAIEIVLPTLPEIPLKDLHPIVLHQGGDEQTRSTDRTFRLFPPKPFDPIQEARKAALQRKVRRTRQEEE